MKRILAVFAIASCFAVSSIADQDVIVLAIDNISTSATYSTATSDSVGGWVERVFVDATIGTNFYTNSLMLIASNTYTGEQRTIIPATVVSYNTNVSVYPRVATVTTAGVVITNSGDMFPLYDDVLMLKCMGASSTNKNTKAYIYTK